MKKLMMMMAMMTTIVVSAQAMPYTQARNEALFLTDKMAYELDLTDRQYEDVYKINLDYLLSITSESSLYGDYWTHRDIELRYVLTAYQYDRYLAAGYFYRPVNWSNNTFTFGIYRTYSNRNYYYRSRPAAYATYRGPAGKGQVNWHSNAPKTPHVGTAPKNHTASTATKNYHTGTMKSSTNNKPSTSHGSTTFGSASTNRNGGSFGSASAKALSNNTSSKSTFGGRR